MNPRTDDLIITDTSPLITLAIADHLHVLTMSRIRIVIPDCEFRRNPAGDSDLKPATVPI